MKIIIAGAGEVGSHLAKMLSNEDHDIALIDNDYERLKTIGSTIDVITYEGSAASIETLQAAGIAKANLFIAVTQSEYTNITAAMLSKRLGAKKCIARIDNMQYLESENFGYFGDLGIDYMFCPEQLAAGEVTNMIQQSGTTDVVTFADGKIFVYVIKIENEAPVLNKKMPEIHGITKETEFKIVAITRNNETFIPTDDDQVIDNDLIYVITGPKGVEPLLKQTGKRSINIRNIMILGGSRIGRNTAMQLGKTHNVKLVEQNRTKSYNLSNQLKGVLVINADGRNVDLLMDEGLAQMDAFVAVTGNSETNMLSCLLAKRMGVKKTIAEIENTDYISLAENMGIDTIINKKMITASRIFRFTMSEDVSSIRCLTASDAEVMEFVAKPESHVTKKLLGELHLPKGAIIGGIVRGRVSTIANPELEIRSFDRVVVFALPEAKSKIGGFFSSPE